MERLMIVRTLEESAGNQSQAAERLGIPRRTFCRKLIEHKIKLSRRKNSATSPSLNSSVDHRTEIDIPVMIRTTEGCCFLAQANDVSSRGMGLRGLAPSVAVSDELALRFTLSGSGRRLSVKATVAWRHPDGTAGVRFLDLNPSKSQFLKNWLADAAPNPAAPTDTPFEKDPTNIRNWVARL
jgi:hypothetical protein